MSRGGIAKETREFDLYGGILKYALAKQEETTLKKTIESFSKNIKQEFKNRDLTEFIAGDIRATLTYTSKEDFNELQAMEILKTALADNPDLLASILKTKEYIDQDAFEKAVYNKQIDVTIMAPAITPKEPTATLRIGKVKT